MSALKKAVVTYGRTNQRKARLDVALDRHPIIFRQRPALRACLSMTKIAPCAFAWVAYPVKHAAIDYAARKKGIKQGQKCSIAEYNKVCAQAVAAQCGCDPGCIEQQLNESLKPTNRNIKHWDSSSNQLDQDLKNKLDQAYKVSPARPTG